MVRAFLKVLDGRTLEPADEATAKYLFRRDVGEIIVTDIKRARSYENHQRFFKFLQITFDMQEHFDQFESYRYWITMKAGWHEAIVVPNGNTIFKAKSIDFESMEEDEFEKLFSACIDAFLKELGSGQTEDDLLNVISFSR